MDGPREVPSGSLKRHITLFVGFCSSPASISVVTLSFAEQSFINQKSCQQYNGCICSSLLKNLEMDMEKQMVSLVFIYASNLILQNLYGIYINVRKECPTYTKPGSTTKIISVISLVRKNINIQCYERKSNR